ncbi:hypothetical protein BU24DRAFT_88803 [Aaosphaeria arxii CBS 175.79]|uniref:Methyltransferase domain-containing protein n=1 Tax=Aaosphaeria arxii CBS 175.79 TaxID=1450172 RepID=A0A6A5X821_9PLEO|nr:uncharacterized protein BU24DRAFT_88803 [Aaosphaeria arxii CBS 175.79]KAF2008957.1 hypothetical protein BU24DRAFT_88803 [Aaosphaeria arxii CBS 175.79]
MRLSEKAWERSVGLRHQMAQAHPNHPQVPFFPAQTLSDFGKYPYTLWDFFPPVYTCPHDIQRVGRLGDGGKWVCGMSVYEETPKAPFANPQDGIVMYSFGINGESSFEAEMLERVPNLRIWGYDYSVGGWGPQIPEDALDRVFFGKVGLGDEDDVSRDPPFYSLPSLMKQNNHTYMDILKIDIEGSEYGALDAMMDAFAQSNDGVLPIGQVMIEIHLVRDQTVNFERFTSWWERLEKMGMRPTWLEINLMAVTLGKGKTDPRCVEYVWVNAKDRKNILWE